MKSDTTVESRLQPVRNAGDPVNPGHGAGPADGLPLPAAQAGPDDRDGVPNRLKPRFHEGQDRHAQSSSSRNPTPHPQPPTPNTPLITYHSSALGDLLRARGLTLAVAESCTGGGLANAITDIAGSSDYFLGGVVSYSNSAKERLLGVEAETLAAHGAVSEPVARAMAEGVKRLFQADLAAGITGIVGPGGGGPEKPVGLVYIAVTSSRGTEVRRYLWDRDRVGNKALSVDAALAMLVTAISHPL